MASLTVKRNSRLEIRKWLEWLLEDYANAQAVDSENEGVGISLHRALKAYRTAEIDAKGLEGWCGAALEWARSNEAIKVKYPQVITHYNKVAKTSRKYSVKHPLLSRIVEGYDELIEKIINENPEMPQKLNYIGKWSELKLASSDAG